MIWDSFFSGRIAAMGHSDVVAILKLAERPDVISFAGGLPDPDTFLLHEIRKIFDEVTAQNGRSAFGYGPAAGISPLREWLAQHMTHIGRPTQPEECVVTTGGIAALDLICKVLLDPGDIVIVGEPTFVAALHVFRTYQARFAGVPLDENGMQPDALESTLAEVRIKSLRPKLIYMIPSSQNPSGVTLSWQRRKRIIEIATKYNVPIIEDEAYHDLRFEGQTPPLLSSLDPHNVIHINTFSKIFNPGVRLGWLTAPKKLIDAIVLAKQGQDQCASTIGQYLLLAFADQGLISQQTSKALEVYRRKRDAMLGALDKHFPKNARWTKPEGGFYTWVTLPKQVDFEALLPRAIEEASVAYVAGSAFYHNRSGKENIRLSYSYVTEAQIEEGIRRLAHLLSETK